MGFKLCNEGDSDGAFKYYTKAAGLGDKSSHYNLSLLYHDGQGVEKDAEKYIYHLEEAAIGEHAWARQNIGNEVRESKQGSIISLLPTLDIMIRCLISSSFMQMDTPAEKNMQVLFVRMQQKVSQLCV